MDVDVGNVREDIPLIIIEVKLMKSNVLKLTC